MTLSELLYYPVSLSVYHGLLVIHVIAVTFWFVGLFYLPRLFVYHAMTSDPATQKTFKLMEYRLNYYLMHPAMAITLLTGILLTHFYFITYHLLPTWLLLKLGLIVLLLIYQFICGYHLNLFKRDLNIYSHRYFRYFNEFPTLLLIAIVLLVIVKPFGGGWAGF